MKLTIECTEGQAQLLLNCLEESFRFRMKQENASLENVLWERYPDKEKCKDFEKARDRWSEMRVHAEIICKALMDIIYGDGFEGQPKEANEISDMWSVIRHSIYMLDHDGTDFWDVRSDKPMRLSDMPLIKCEVEK